MFLIDYPYRFFSVVFSSADRTALYLYWKGISIESVSLSLLMLIIDYLPLQIF